MFYGCNALTSYFNSIKVRLKLTNCFQGIDPTLLFQFHKGTIKTVLFHLAALMCLDFNSIKVRLKQLASEFQKIKFAFQFHKGTIKTNHLLFLCSRLHISIP